MSRFYSLRNSDEWYTPLHIVDALGPFHLDPASPSNPPNKLAQTTYSLERGEDGLSLPWFGRVWLNPPYSNWAPWLKRLKEHDNGIALISARTETRAFFEYIWDGAHSLYFLKGRVKFPNSEGLPGGSSTAPSVLVSYGAWNGDTLKHCGLPGKFVQI